MTRDYNALTDDAFRAEVRAFFEAEYPPHLRYILRRARWDKIKAWWDILYQKGWVAPVWPVERGGMGLDVSKMLIYIKVLKATKCQNQKSAWSLGLAMPQAAP